MEMDLDTCLGRIRYVSELRKARRYLEIGVRDGATFFKVELPFKTAVDPVFLFDSQDHAAPGVTFFPLPSDIFFYRLRSGKLTAGALQHPGGDGEKIAFDVIFIDGLHTFEQSYKDFTNSLAFSHEGTVWVMDDTVPCDGFSAIPDESLSLRLRTEAGLPDLPWHGDVFKTVMAIHDRHPEYSYCTMMGGNAQTIIWKAERSGRLPFFDSLRTIGRLSYHDMIRHSALLMPVEDEQMPELLGKCLSPMECLDPEDNSLTKRIHLEGVLRPSPAR